MRVMHLQEGELLNSSRRLSRLTIAHSGRSFSVTAERAWRDFVVRQHDAAFGRGEFPGRVAAGRQVRPGCTLDVNLDCPRKVISRCKSEVIGGRECFLAFGGFGEAKCGCAVDGGFIRGAWFHADPHRCRPAEPSQSESGVMPPQSKIVQRAIRARRRSYSDAASTRVSRNVFIREAGTCAAEQQLFPAGPGAVAEVPRDQ
jgi:hypothetical protein